MKNACTLPATDVERLAGATHHDPFSALGPHRLGEGRVVRVFDPHAESVSVVPMEGAGEVCEAERVHPAGLWEARVGGEFSYLLRVRRWGEEVTGRDPYSFGPLLGELDLHLMGEGRHWDLHRRMGAHVREVDGASGVLFAVWAPNAERVSVVGDFNRWDGRLHPMRLHPGNGVWELFVPGAREGAHYKFEIRSRSGEILLKSDPFAFHGQHGLQTASIVYPLGRHVWRDGDWMRRRAAEEWHRRPVSIYEVHAGSWARVAGEGNRPLSYLELADRLLPYVVELGFTHIELMPLAEHPFDGSWGYQVTGYFAPTSRHGTPDELCEFVDRCHAAGIGVIMDWVPGHFPKDAHGLARFDGTCLYEHLDPRQGEHRDWGTLIFNYGRAEVANFLISNAVFWLEQYHLDGLRVDAVASMLYLDYSREPGDWVPNACGGRENLEAIAFLRLFNEVCHARFPGILTVAEESTAWPMVSRPTWAGGLGFGFKWNMGWMNDSLAYMAKDPVHRRFHQQAITFSLLYAFHEHFVLVLSHDEVVHGKRSLLDKMPGDTWQKFANLRLFLAWMWAHPGKKLLFMGGEFGQWNEWNHAASLDWHLCEHAPHAGVRALVRDLNGLLRAEPALHARDDSHEGFEWIDFHDAENSVVSFLRRAGGGDDLLVAVNATPVPRYGYRIGAPVAGRYAEILNSDAVEYGGSGLGNLGGIDSEPVPCHGRPNSLRLVLPPLATVILRVPGGRCFSESVGQ